VGLRQLATWCTLLAGWGGAGSLLAGAATAVVFGSDRFDARVGGYWNRVDDAVANVTVGSGPRTVDPCGFVPEGGVCRQRRNLGSTRGVGAEVETSYRPGRRLQIDAGCLFGWSVVTQAPVSIDLDGKQVPQVPRHQAVVTVGYRPIDRWRISVRTRYLGDRFEDDLNTRALGGFVSVDASVGRELAGGWELAVGADNLTGNRYAVAETADGLSTLGPPTLIHAALRYAGPALR